jgi:glycosyltransferase involved in cell wall biosynthesis/SAM-dependent methyltransferase
MTLTPLVSVVIPCLNRAHFIEPTIESVMQQEYPQIECIVVDGGSTDGSREIIQQYNGRIKLISERDNGHADAINKGFKMSRGEILAWLNADDVWVVPNAVTAAVTYLNENPEVDVVYGDCGSIDVDGQLIGLSYVHEWDLAYAVEHCDHCIPQPAAFMRRRILERIGWLDASFISKKDHELWLRIGLAGEIHHIPNLLAHARACPGYLADRGDITAEACVKLTKKFFTLPGVPNHVMARRRRALGNSYIRGMDYAWHDGRYWRVILQYALRASMMNPADMLSVLQRLGGYLKPTRAGHLFLTLRHLARSMRRWLRGSKRQSVNLEGDRDIEWSWVAAHIPFGSGAALDFGSGGSYLGLIAAQRGFHVTSVDLEPIQRPYIHPHLSFIGGDLLKLPLPAGHFELVINCSTVEHVGLPGRYGVAENIPAGDLHAMARLRGLMKPGGAMLLTIPVGQDALFAPLCRVYGKERLPLLLEDYAIEKETYWTKDNNNQWVLSTRDAALNFKASAGSWDPLENVYALGCFVLRKSG